jgi:hypothetical protein
MSKNTRFWCGVVYAYTKNRKTVGLNPKINTSYPVILGGRCKEQKGLKTKPGCFLRACRVEERDY